MLIWFGCIFKSRDAPSACLIVTWTQHCQEAWLLPQWILQKNLKVCTKNPQCSKDRRDVWFIMEVTRNLMQLMGIAKEMNVIQICSDEDKILVSQASFFLFLWTLFHFCKLEIFLWKPQIRVHVSMTDTNFTCTILYEKHCNWNSTQLKMDFKHQVSF